MYLFLGIFWLLVLWQFASIILLSPLLAVRGRGVPKTVHRPRLGWAVVGSYLVLCLIVILLLIGTGPFDEEAREDLANFIPLIIGLPWSQLIGFILQSINRSTSGQFFQLWAGWNGLASIISCTLNCWIAYQIGKRLPVLWAPRPVPPPPPLLADLLSRSIVRRSVLVCGVVVLVGFGWWYIRREPSDNELIARFRANRAVFDQLVQMYIADDRDELIDVDGSYRMRPAYPAPEGPGYPVPERLDYTGKPIPSPIPHYDAGYPAPTKQAEPGTLAGVDENRRMEYVTLLKQVGLTSIWPGTLNQGLYDGTGFSRDYPGPHRIVRLVVSAKKMFIYSQAPLRLAINRFVAPAPERAPLAEGVSVADSIEIHCRRFEDQWYLCDRMTYN